MGDNVDNPDEKIREKYAARQEKQKERYETHKVAVASGEKKLVVERQPTGLYYVRFEGGGALPEELKGKFTSINVLKNVAERRYGAGILK
jgi:hypothetical protein